MNPQEIANNGNCIYIFQIWSNRKKIDVTQLDLLNIGDHVGWERPWAIWHHAIVVTVDVQARRLRIIHFTKKEVTMEEINVEEEWGDFYRFEYSQEIIDENPPENVIERAVSQIGYTNYHLLRRNCEHFATFCKTGIWFSTQVEWTCASTTETIKLGCRRAMQLALEIVTNQFSEMFENDTYSINFAFLLGFLGAYRCLKDINEYQQNNMQRVDILEAAIKRVILGALCVGFSIFVSAAGKAVGKDLGKIIGRIAGESIGSHIPKIGTSKCEALGSAIIAFMLNILGGTLVFFRGEALGVFCFSLIKYIFLRIARRV